METQDFSKRFVFYNSFFTFSHESSIFLNYVVICRIKFWYESWMLEILPIRAKIWKMNRKKRTFSKNIGVPWKFLNLFERFKIFLKFLIKVKPFPEKLEKVSILMTNVQDFFKKMFQNFYETFCSFL